VRYVIFYSSRTQASRTYFGTVCVRSFFVAAAPQPKENPPKGSYYADFGTVCQMQFSILAANRHVAHIFVRYVIFFCVCIPANRNVLLWFWPDRFWDSVSKVMFYSSCTRTYSIEHILGQCVKSNVLFQLHTDLQYRTYFGTVCQK
jgi:hypothetical protein